MTATFFLETNILLYAASNAAADQAKRQIACGLLTRSAVGFSAQALQEFYAAAIAKKHLQMTHEEAVAVLQSLAAFPVWPISRDLAVYLLWCHERIHATHCRPCRKLSLVMQRKASLA